MIAALALLLALPVVLEALARSIGLPMPGAVAAYILLLTWLTLRGEVPEMLARASETLVQFLPLLFVPPALGILAHQDLLRADFLALVAGIVFGTCAGLLTTALVLRELETHGTPRPTGKPLDHERQPKAPPLRNGPRGPGRPSAPRSEGGSHA